MQNAVFWNMMSDRIIYIFFLRQKEKLPTNQNTQRQISHNSNPYSMLILCIPDEEDVTYSFTILCRVLTQADATVFCVMKCDNIFLGWLWNEMKWCS